MKHSRAALAAPILVFVCSFAGTALAQDVCDGVSPTANAGLDSVVVVTGLTGRPLLVTAPPEDTGRIFVAEQDGLVWVRQRGAAPTDRSLFLDLTGVVNAAENNEMGLLGLAFDPDYATNGFFYVNYTETAPDRATVVARYTVSSGDPDVADPSSEVRLLRFSQPEGNHNGGHLMFGLDGFLYVATGDGGGFGDNHGTCGNGQNLATALGKILRIDPSGGTGNAPDCGGTGPYTIPAANPFADGAGGNCDEIWAYGLRNPWRLSFDRGTGDLYVGDVGQNCWEEIDYVAAPGDGGQNFGWRQMEGSHCYNASQFLTCDPTGLTCGGSPPCQDPSLVDPIFEYLNRNQPECSVTGGYVYRGCRMSAFQGTYFYADYCSGWIRSFDVVGGTPANPADWTSDLSGGFLVTSFGEDAQGEIYLADRAGRILKIVPPFADLEVAGAGVLGADLFLLSSVGDWTWEDVQVSTDWPVSFYRVYRGQPNGSFDCIHTTPDPVWPAGGDPTIPAAGDVAAYAVTAVSVEGSETATGHPGTFDASSCP